MDSLDIVLSPKQAADHLGVTVAHLQRLRSEGGGPKFCRLGKRRLAYRASDLSNWLEQNAVSSTSHALKRREHSARVSVPNGAGQGWRDAR